MKLILFLITLMISASSWASSFNWDAQGYCVTEDWSGKPKRIPDSYCGRDVKSWGEDGYCYKYAGSGRLKGRIPDQACGKNYYEWDVNGECIKYAGSQREISKVDKWACYVLADE